MSEQKIWAYFLQLSIHMWDDENTQPRGMYLAPRYTDENGCDVATWDELVRFIAERKYNMCVIDVGDGIQYESHPEISAPDAWSKDFLKKKLDEMRALGIEPIPKLNFSACHHCWLREYRRMVSTPTYYRVCADVIAEVCEAFGYPRLFHLGMDEENAPNQVYREMTIIRGEKLLWHDMDFFFRECEKHGARPWVWSDYYWHHPDLFRKYMPKSVMQSNWFYYMFREDPARPGHLYTAIETYEELDRLGYDQIPGCSTWNNNTNTFQTLAFCKDRLNDALLKGFLTIPWTSNKADDEYMMKNDAHRLFVARQKVYPETL